MNKHLQEIVNLIQQGDTLTAEQKAAVLKSLKDADKELEITTFKLDRTEKVKRTTAILLEETIEELEQKRKAVEAQNKELEIEAALERVRARTMAMQKSDELSETAVLLFHQLTSLGLDLKGCGFNIWEKDDKTCTAWMSGPNGELSPAFNLPLTEDPFFIRYAESKKNGEDFWVYETGKEELIARYQYLRTLPGLGERITKDQKDNMEPELPPFVVDHVVNFANGNLVFVTNKSHPESWDIFRRFGKVFEQTYTRFLDLQKAEAQARESQIQLALERVRARTMAMQKSEELGEISSELFRQVQSLGITSWHCAFNIYDEDQNSSTEWGTNAGGTYPIYKTPRERIFLKYYETAQTGVPLHIEVIGEDRCADHYEWLCTLPGIGEQLVKLRDSGVAFPASQVDHVAYFKYGYLIFISYQQEPWAHEIFIRFAKVFEQTYTRFLDLQKAEAQARESQIQLALERVRARTMAMHQSNELADTASILFRQIKELGFETWSCGFCTWTQNDLAEVWMAADSGGLLPPMLIPYKEEPTHAEIYKASLRGEPAHDKIWEGEELENHYSFLKTVPSVKTAIDILETSGLTLPARQCYYVGFFKGGYLLLITKEPNEGLKELSKRFSSVFDLTYTRFLDLKKAETQVREAKIESALERTRTQSMIMQHSKELDDTLRVFHEQVLLLGIPSAFSFLWLPDEEKDRHIFWAAWAENNSTVFKSKAINYPLDRNEPATTQCLVDWKNNEPVVSYHVPPASVKGYFAAWSELIAGVNELTPENFSDGLYYVEAFMKYGCFGVMVKNNLPEDEKRILSRFAVEFERTYTRFLDLQKAEAQTRESQVQLALERVRARTMAMQHSDELLDAATLLFQQTESLGASSWNCSFNIWMEDKKYAVAWNGTKDGFGRPFNTPASEDVFLDFYEAAQRGDELYVKEIGGKELELHYEYLSTLPGVGETLTELKAAGVALPAYQVFNIAYFAQGYLMFITYYPVPGFADIFKRFAKVFEQTYTRFLDLQKAEAQALEAIKRASVDRVRAEIASMRTPKDLERIQPLIWNELTTLSISFTRCGVFIMDEEQQLVHTFLSTPEGKAIATLHVPFQFDLSIITNGVDHWRRKEMYTEYWDANAFIKSWIALSSVSETPRDSNQQEQPPENLYLHMLPFVQGMLYVGNDTPLNEVELQLVQNLADAFATAYARYEDFNKLEAAKKQVDSTLNELQATQKQLIQAEKMASLGELTAGIAHEIQNPLNFVNNFSDVNTELIEELKNELTAGNTEEVIAIANDIKSNEEKINHHGKRADAIVKGMLQHSRSTGNTKEPADINVLADEYLRLAYHGLRAKDKFFNATMKTNFDETIGKINIVPQDIGRVMLNLYNNAFYAVSPPFKGAISEAASNKTPTLWVSTKKAGNVILISVKDNGNGIPQNIIDKIFQPFFTTKPTGQGTGLGLSLSYDIIKAHGGELSVTSKEGTGAEFIIQLPVKPE